MSTEKELRKSLCSSPLEARVAAAGSDSAGTISGVIHTYGTEADLGSFTETILPGAFDGAVAEANDICCFFNHEADNLLGRTSARTALFTPTSSGLSFRCTLPNTNAGRDVYALAKRGDLRGCSFAFRVEDGDDVWENRSGKPYRTIKRISKLYEAGPVSLPAYPQGTSVDARSLGFYSASVRRALGGDGELRRRAAELGRRIREDDARAAGIGSQEDYRAFWFEEFSKRGK